MCVRELIAHAHQPEVREARWQVGMQKPANVSKETLYALTNPSARKNR
jgi:hypothetical protein